MSSVNKVILVGNLGADPELKYTTSNHPVCNLRLATSHDYKDKQGVKQENTEWHQVVCFGTTAEMCAKYLAKGRKAYVEGRLQTRSWEKDGVKKYMTEVVADRVVFLDGGNRGGGKGEAPSASTPADDDGIPF